VEVAEVRLVVEISDSTLVFDSTTKARLYAQNLIPVYWIVNIPDSRIEVYSTPTGGESAQYSQRTDFVAGQSVPVVLDGVTVAELAVTDLFG
jgi:Uma2 family endonuclease